MSDTLNKLTAILNAKAPYSNTAGKDALDIALIFGSFEQPTSLFFQGDGVWQLMQGQDGAIISVKDYLKTFAAFEFYDLENIYICQESLTQRGLTAAFHIEQVKVLAKKEFAEKLASHHTVLRF
ncbi:sulfurtransferase complex subunit TusC [Candidatus Colwellia aromaticivorans]|uniref:sulfurtransferase complex subunit TusC n=1 Tax=Candidatus Colwellia aromaticivorans TaxID=2267621 RepID=UPI000DF10F69|nr:sulfurtransferase complex subunit TusC [Candidatus Colwellia aromaticivorans]